MAKEVDIEKEVERIARKSNFNMRKSEYSFEKQIKNLDNEIDKAVDDKIKLFNESKGSTQEYLDIEFNYDTIDRYREKLRKM